MSRHWRKRLVGLGGIAATLGWTVPAHAHAFGQRYDLPVPLWLYLAGAGAAVALSFAAVGLFVRGNPGLHAYPRLNLLRWRGGRFLAHPFTLFVVKLFALSVFVLVLLAGYLGNQNPIRNVTPTMVWIIWWVGLAFVSPLLGNLWALINPWKIAFAWAEALYRHFKPGEELSARHSYPKWLGVWPGVILFFAFAWAELVWDGSVVPLKISFAATVYSLITWFGMFLFGREQWLRHGKAFSVVFGILARFAPTEVRVREPGRLSDLFLSQIRVSRMRARGQGLCQLLRVLQPGRQIRPRVELTAPRRWSYQGRGDPSFHGRICPVGPLDGHL